MCAGHGGNKEGWKCCEGRTVSPKRAGLREAGAAALAEQGDGMRKRVAARDGEGELLPVGTVVQFTWLTWTAPSLTALTRPWWWWITRAWGHMWWPTERVGIKIW
jgi:hypothetical protein